MASDDLKLDGVTLTLEECREVLAWVDEPWRRIPDVLGDTGDGCLYLGRGRLTPERIERIRDHVMPWTEVRRDEVEPGEVFFMSYDVENECVALPCRPASDDPRTCWHWAKRSGEQLNISAGATVLVRRPRKPALTLRDVQPGQRFRFVKSEGYVHRRTVQGWLEEATWSHTRLPPDDNIADTPVELRAWLASTEGLEELEAEAETKER